MGRLQAPGAADLWPGPGVYHLQTLSMGLGRGSCIRPGFSPEEPRLFQAWHSRVLIREALLGG